MRLIEQLERVKQLDTDTRMALAEAFPAKAYMLPPMFAHTIRQ